MTGEAQVSNELRVAGERWHIEFAKAFITQVSASGEYHIKAKFKTMAEMHEAFDAMSKLAALTRPVEE